MDDVKLLDRIDTKFVIHRDSLPGYLEAIKSQYMVLSINDQLIHPYETLYFDTPDFRLYQMHHNGVMNRYKLRCRKYVSSGDSFFEIKTKTNKSRTCKQRIPVDDIPECLDEPLHQYIQDHTPKLYTEYVPALRVYFDRLTLVNKSAGERLTFDLNLRYEYDGVIKEMLNMVIVEVKQQKCSVSPFKELMKARHHHKDYLSKYCMGLTCIHKDLKMNNFKRKITALNKQGYEIH
jgi:hypothetical protein